MGENISYLDYLGEKTMVNGSVTNKIQVLTRYSLNLNFGNWLYNSANLLMFSPANIIHYMVDDHKYVRSYIL